jgi:predicted ATPase
MLRLALRQQDPLLLVPAYRAIGAVLRYMGEFALAQAHLEQGLALYDIQQHATYVLVYGQDQGVICLLQSGCLLWFLGYPDQAVQRSREAISLAQKLAHPYSLAYALCGVAWVFHYRREARAVQAWAEATLTLATEKGFGHWLAASMIYRGWALAEQGQGEEGLTQLRQGLVFWGETGAELLRHSFLGFLAEVHAKMNQVKEGLAVVTEALAAVPATGGYWEAELYRLKGELLLKGEAEELQAEAEAEECFWQALEVAQRQETKSLELRATVSLSRLQQKQGKKEEARQRLAKIYDWFTEGFDTVDLQEAKALLEELSGKR